jgi:hypothetical protein
MSNKNINNDTDLTLQPDQMIFPMISIMIHNNLFQKDMHMFY